MLVIDRNTILKICWKIYLMSKKDKFKHFNKKKKKNHQKKYCKKEILHYKTGKKNLKNKEII